MLGVILILASLLAKAVIVTSFTNDSLRNRSFVFISGWPQSGTSLLHQMVDQHPHFSSMIAQCEKIIGAKHCNAFNHEGQWVLSNPLKQQLLSGKVCPVQSFDNDTATAIRQEVNQQLSQLY